MDVVTTPQPLDLRASLRPLWRRRWLILAVVVAVTAATYIYSRTETQMYRTSTEIRIRNSQAEQALTGASDSSPDDRLVSDQARLIHTRAVAARVARQIGYHGSLTKLLSKVTAAPQAGSDFVVIEARDTDPRRAAAIANGFAQSFITLRGADVQQRIRAALASAQQDLANLPAGAAGADARKALEARIQSLRVAQSLPAGNAEFVDPAQVPRGAFQPTPLRSAAFAFVLSLLLGGGLAYALESLDRRLKRTEEAETIYGQSALASIPRASTAALGGQNGFALDPHLREDFRYLRLNLTMTAPDDSPRKLLVTSAIAGEGKSSVVRNLAFAYEEAGLRVAVVDADLRRSAVAALFGVPATPGLTDALGGAQDPRDAMRSVQVFPEGSDGSDGNANGAARAPSGAVAVLTSGTPPPNPPAVLATKRVATLLDDLATEYDVVLVDSAPLLPVSDALPLLTAVDGVILTVRLDYLTRDQAQRTADLLNRLPHADVLGLVVTAVPEAEQDYRYGDYGPE